MKNFLMSARARAFLFLLASFVAVPRLHADTNLYSSDIWALVDAKQIMAAAASITTSNYPDCDEATVERKMERLYRADGSGECQDESFTKVLTEKGKRNNRTITLSFMLPYSRSEAPLVEVIAPDGQVTPVDLAANSKETIDDSQMSANIYDPNMRVLQINIPKLDVGDVVHAVTRQTILRPIMPGEYAEENLLEGTGYIRHMSYEVHAPAGRPLQRIALRDEVAGTVKYTTRPDADGGVLHHWEITNVPRMFEEPAMPPFEMTLQRLLVSTTPDWKTVSRWYWDLSASHLAATAPGMEKTVQDLTAGAKTDLERVKAIFYYVSKNIRYMGLTPEKDRPGYEPHDVKITFEKKYGVCRDKAALLVAMLNAAGLHAYPVLIDVGAKRDQEVADPFFNHAIVAVELKKGSYTLMDPTDEHTRELLPTGDCNHSFLVCRDGGEDLMTSPIQPPEDHLMRIKTTGVLNASGALEAKSELEFNGVNDDEYRNAFSHMKPDDRRRFFERNLKESMPGARLKSLRVTPENMLDTSETLRVALEFSVEGMTANGHGKSIVSVPWIGKDFGIVNFILGGAGLEKRKYPMRTFVACGLQEDVSLKLEGGFRGAVSLPKCAPIDDDASGYHETFSAREDELDCSRDLKLKVVDFSPAQYLRLKQELKALQYDARKAPILAISDDVTEPAHQADAVADTSVESNARILESHKELAVTDAHTSLYKVRYAKKILNYAGKIREAEVKLNFNPSCQDVKLTRAVVVSPKGDRVEISPGEINLMDAGWNSSAKRYTGGKILVANLPGVEIGSSIEVEYEMTSSNRPFVSGFESFQLPDEMDHKSFQLTAPPGLVVHELVSGPRDAVKEDARHDEKAQSFLWQSDHAAALPAERSLPPGWAYNSGVSYFVGDMRAYLKELNDTMLERSGQRAKVVAALARLTNSAASPLETAQAIRDFVAKTIRLAGPNFTDLPLRELSPADVTLADGYGHTADRAILLHAFFSAAGFQPEFVLASGLPPISGITNVADTFPLPEWFSSPLVKVTIGGVPYYFNDTDEYAKLGATGRDGMLGLDLGSETPEVIHAAADCADKTDTTYHLATTDSGLTRVTVATRYYGDDYTRKHKYFAELPPEERRRYFQEAVSGVAQGARPIGGLTTQFDTYPGLEQFTVEVDNYSVVDGKYFYFDLPFTPSLFPVGSDHRALPIFLDHRSRNTVRTEIELPAGFNHIVMAPASATLEAPGSGGSARVSATTTGGLCVITHELDAEPAIVDPKAYPGMLKLEASLERKSSRAFLLEKE
ncbi:MAG TPA: DUF3857 domain-containing protein [Verrucomicrobiae bacterium]|jgi:transglutaminase-like putative cysteine protease|nr:DUF3857 domain-containing protein [Verrucomicrobiae bacterium]